ncbi:tripartite tricarboxylate transporter permease [Candidatus Woesearchaeota archaeon]|nr:tripartite tricarboxylate transporter permease [Candidatus Woesearchaeota archaeon]
MFTEILVATLLGIIAGTFTGLVPGIHVNLVAVMLLSISAKLLGIAGVESIACFIISMSITHSFVSTIPSIFLGAPEPSSALSVLPGHRLFLEGKGLEAVKLTIIGSLFGLIISFIFYYFFEQIINIIYPIASKHIPELLLIAGIFIISRTDKKGKALFTYVTAGILGVMVLNSRIENPLFPLLSGLFGCSTLIFSLKEKSVMPEQKLTKKTELNIKTGIKNSMLGAASGFITAILPGLGSSTAAGIASIFSKESDAKNFLIMMGSITTVNFFMSIAALSVLGKARNGAVIVVKELWQVPETSLLIAAAMISGGISVFSAKKCAEKFLKIMKKIKYESVVKIVLSLITIMTYILSGYLGLLILVVSTILGLYVNIVGIPRNTMMACIMVPVMTFFLTI